MAEILPYFAPFHQIVPIIKPSFNSNFRLQGHWMYKWLNPPPPHYNEHPEHVTMQQQPLKPPIRQKKLSAKNDAFGHRVTRRSWELCAKKSPQWPLFKPTQKACKNISCGRRSCQIRAISVPNDPSPLDLKWGNTFISAGRKRIIWNRKNLSVASVPLKNLELFLSRAMLWQGGLTPGI